MYAVIAYGFPLILLLFEWGLRKGLDTDASGYVGPTLAAAALCFLATLTKPKELEVNIESLPGNVSVTSRGDRNVVACVWLLLLLTLFAWAASCYLSVKKPDLETWRLATHHFIGIAAYIVSIIMVAIKEKV